MPGEASGVPARGYSWPPFERGHELSLKYGAHSPRKVDPIAAAFVDGLLEVAKDQAPHLLQPIFRPAVEAWARAEARVQLLLDWVGGMTVECQTDHGAGKRSPVELLAKFETQAATARARLGMDPVSAAKLARDLSAKRAMDRGGISSLVEQGRAVERQREQDGGGS